MNEDEFSRWYNDMIDKAQLCDKRYPIKGMNIWRPYGWKIMKLLDGLIHREMERTSHDEVCFPLLIPEEEFQKEADHIEGFGDDVYWVTHAGKNELDVKLLLRPTSETAMYSIFPLWIRSHTDLPLKTYQVVNVFRYETKQTRAFIRVREIHFFEAHTCHTDFEDAERQIEEDLEIMKNLAKDLCIPFYINKRPEWDKFAGAFYSLGIDAIMPTGKTLQIGGIHQYKENFAKPYEITYEDEEGEHRYCHQTTYGMSERLVGALVGIHGDEKGIMLPPAVAPYQIVIIPIPAKGKKEMVDAEAGKLLKQFEDVGIRTHVDLSDDRPGSKFYDWEIKGVPLRAELGPRDIENEKVVLVRRDTGEKAFVARDEVAQIAKELLEDISSNLLKRAEAMFKNSTKEPEDLAGLYEGEEPVSLVYWCGNEECATEMETTAEINVLGSPRNIDLKEGRCLVCGQMGKQVMMARTY